MTNKLITKQPEEQLKIIKKGLFELINEEDLLSKLKRSYDEQKPLVVKLGLDPSAPDIHLGHTVVLRKIKQLQDLGHHAVIIIGDFTGRIGDPTGRSKVRNQMTKEEVLINARTYEDQIMKVLDPEKTEVRFNSEWLKKLDFEDVILLAGKVTVARILERDDFSNRYKNQQAIGLHEFFYPLMQAYDSVHIGADIELGGTDQTFNILMGRSLQKDYGLESQIAMFVPILEGVDGVNKMSKSLGNYIGIDEDPDVIYRKVMTIPDNLIIRYFELVTDIHPDEVEVYKRELESGEVNPRDIKMSLACEITSLYHGIDKAEAAERHFQVMYQQREVPDNIKEYVINQSLERPELMDNGEIDLPMLICNVGFAKSKSEARRLLTQNAVKIDGERFSELTYSMQEEGFIIAVGKNKIVKVVNK
ncbi:tyrosyl-tRNA synthetase [Anaerosporobacter mobilis DSM 15930]|jgi:tyrosyl-tRNA synthetase|uniref:Tyrosine--tRNA ligase n=1 Tax=Anaerosporobacter mobilis DSM 15930 TaxID=1120996 RepID=A0A1M7HGE0_9FIRM|nr:tyrosine--tRNA ligase [Anaerosporobacter mobilis]SHM27514.1 tyrosyl-tRNA synthetase [Anaerosporobacter mobilis DSM 15930]